MDDKLMQCFALATSLVSAVAAVLAFSQSGWRSTVRATLLVMGAGGVAYVVLIPQKTAVVGSTPSPVLSLPGPTGTPEPLPLRYPSVYLASEVIECPHCRTPYSSSGYGGAVNCPACSQTVDLVPAGRYYTIHCCCGNWVKAPYQYPGGRIDAVQIPYFCPQCRAQGTITPAPTGRD